MTKKVDLAKLTPEQVNHMVACTELVTSFGGYERSLAKLEQWTRNREAHHRSNARRNAKIRKYDELVASGAIKA